MKKTLLALALIGASTSVMADSWLYGGFSGGQADLSGEKSTIYGVHAGTGILPFIGLEAGYWDLGKFDSFSYNGSDLTNVNATSVYFAAKPSIDFGPLHIYAKAGVHSYQLDGKKGAGSFKEDDFDMMYGVGAEYFIFGPLSVGASYQNFKVKHDNIGSFTLNATIHFL